MKETRKKKKKKKISGAGKRLHLLSHSERQACSIRISAVAALGAVVGPRVNKSILSYLKANYSPIYLAWLKMDAC